ncbi:unnamed protein product [Mesocestoides corti]|uniref:Uncharacterized protein n=1 Tax=Mesocestoides corti TaxID=53468 RepID=A0A158QSG1_MESCO|nr:unnamed protein product [Mesocestoides corti]
MGPHPVVSCRNCDDELDGCRSENIVDETCQPDTIACMVEVFFAPNSTKFFNFRAGCSPRDSCPEGYELLMCTGFIDGIKTCRQCCFENNCHDPTPGSGLRVSVMKKLMLETNIQTSDIDRHLQRETDLAFGRGATTATPKMEAPSKVSPETSQGAPEPRIVGDAKLTNSDYPKDEPAKVEVANNYAGVTKDPGDSSDRDSKVSVGILILNIVLAMVPPVPGVEFEVFKANPYLYDLYEKGYFEIFENAMDSDSVPDDEKIAVTFYLAQHTNFLSNTGFSVESLKDVLKSLNATHAANCGGWITSTVNTLFSAAQNNDTFGVSDVLTNSLVEANMLEGSEEYPIMVDVNLADLRGVTPLHVASANLSYDVVKLLLSYGANTNALTVDGISCLSFCVCTYVDRHPVQIGSDSHLIELNRDEITTEKWFRAEISWLLGSDNDIHEEILEVEEKHNPEEENYTETGFMSLLRDFCRPGYSLATIASTFNKYMSPNEFLDALIKEKVPKFARQTKLRKIGGQHRKCLVTKATQIDPEDLKYLRKSIRVSRRLETVLTLLQYGADPNASSVPMTPLIAASRPADLELTRLLLHFGADPNVRIQARPDTAAEVSRSFYGNVRELGVIGLTPLHFAVLTPGEVGVELTRMLLDFGADPNARAEPDDSFLPRSQACDKVSRSAAHSSPGEGSERFPSRWCRSSSRYPPHLVRFGEVFVKSSEVDGGRTALHLACARNYDLKHSAAIVELLMDRGGDPNLLCNGHSPLSVAIASGNDKIVELLVSYQLTNLTMRLTKGLGSALCVVFNPMYENSRNLQCRLTLLSHLIRRCPNGLVNHRIAIPPDNTEGGSVVDYAFQVYSSVGPSLLERPFAPVNSTDHQVFSRDECVENAPSGKNDHPARHYGFYENRFYMRMDEMERLQAENFPFTGNYSLI